MSLAETVFASVILTLLALFVPVLNRNLNEAKVNDFVEGLSSDLNLGMSYSMTHFTLVKMKFYPGEFKYTMTDGYANAIKINMFDPRIKIDSYLTNDTIEITHGTVVGYYYFYIDCGEFRYKVSIADKSGLIHVAK